ncbi:MAG: phage portal protein [Clostridia bacterium]|nr:phage portal protein [Clostridia bacterium]
MVLTGRRVIYTDEREITAENVVSVLNKATKTHSTNSSEIEYLYNYYKGDQPVLYRVKDVRPEIQNNVVVNRANEIVSFKAGYLMGEPIQYISKGEGLSEKIQALNDFMYSEGKAKKDMSVATWFYICGQGYKLILPDNTGEMDEAPFEIYSLDPRTTFVVYDSGLGNKPLMGVTFTKVNRKIRYSIYTKTEYFEIEGNEIIVHDSHTLGEIPIIEYFANDARLGAFEIVLGLLDAINTVESNRVDGIEQFVQALMIFYGVDIDTETFTSLKELGGLKVPSDGDVKYLIQELNQSQTQTVVDDMYQTILTICGMPNRNGGSSTSDTGSAVILRDGWSDAEARAKDAERCFKESELTFLKIAIRICNKLRQQDLKLSQIDIRFTRRNYENIQMKAQVLTTLLGCGKVHPQLAFSHSGMFADPDLAYEMSEEYVKTQTPVETEAVVNE